MKLTIFTPTYNRAYVLSRLKDSLCRQDRFEFEWLVIDDGSVDNTEQLCSVWKKEHLPFVFRYEKVQNGGKPRAINKACELANTDWMFIIDSDDVLADNMVGFLINAINQIEKEEHFVGVGVLRGRSIDTPFGRVNFKEYVDATNLDRVKYGLDFDCNEVYRISALRQFPFEVWQGETFTPEEVVLNEMSLHGYKLRWYNKIGVISEYLSDGLTKGAWGLVKKNPMGYAMMYNHKLKYTTTLRQRANYVCQFIALTIFAGNYQYLWHCKARAMMLLLLPIGFVLSIRRKLQFKTL